MKICWQVLLVTQESCANVTFESCVLLILRCALSQSFKLVGKTTLTVCTHENSGCYYIYIFLYILYYYIFYAVLSIHRCDSAKGISNWYVHTLFVDNFERQIWERSNYESLYPWTNVNHMLLVNTSGFWLVSNGNSFP